MHRSQPKLQGQEQREHWKEIPMQHELRWVYPVTIGYKRITSCQVGL
jgi:hypothetical protein